MGCWKWFMFFFFFFFLFNSNCCFMIKSSVIKEMYVSRAWLDIETYNRTTFIATIFSYCEGFFFLVYKIFMFYIVRILLFLIYDLWITGWLFLKSLFLFLQFSYCYNVILQNIFLNLKLFDWLRMLKRPRRF